MSIITSCGKIVHMDKATFLGLGIGFGGIIIGNILEGGHTSSLMQFTAFVIVFTGTLGAVMVSSSEKDLKSGMQLAKKAFENDERDFEPIVLEIVDIARSAKKDSLLSLETRINKIADPILKGVLKNTIDGVEPDSTRRVFETLIEKEEEELLSGAKIWADAGGYSPTIGIIGAVLGLIHVMGNLTDTSKLGAGIAVAFVATVYGVAFANLLFLPLGNKIKKKIQRLTDEKVMILDGALQIATGANPLVIEQEMRALMKVRKSSV